MTEAGARMYTEKECILMLEKLYDMGFTDADLDQMGDLPIKQLFDLVEGKTQA